MARNEISFNKQTLERIPLPEPGKRVEYYDSKTPGLHLRVTGAGAKTFAVLKWVKGEAKPERVTLGRFPDWSIEAARRAAARIGAAIAEGRNPAQAARDKRAELTFGQMFELYLERYAIPRGKKTVPAMRQMFERYLGELPEEERKPHGQQRAKDPAGVNWQNRKLSAIKHADLVRLHAALGRAGRRHAANRVVQLVKALFNKALEWKLCDVANPAKGIELYREPKRDRFIQADELPRFFNAVKQEPSKDARDFVLLSLLTGARAGDVLAMHWKELNLEGGEWRIPETKNGESQLVQLTAEAIAILESRKASNKAAISNGYVFASDSATGYMSNPKKAWRRILERAEISDLRIHDLRRSLGSWQAKTGASLVIIGKSLGHKTATATMIYSRLDTDPVRDSVNRAASAMLAAANIKGGAAILKFRKAKRVAGAERKR